MLVDVLGHALASELPSASAPFAFGFGSRVAARGLLTASAHLHLAPHKELARISGLLHFSLKPLVPWSSQHKQDLFKAPLRYASLDLVPQRQTLIDTKLASAASFPPCLVAFFFSTQSGNGKATVTGAFLMIYTVDKGGLFTLLSSVYTPLSTFLRQSPKSISLELTGPTLVSQPSNLFLRITLTLKLLLFTPSPHKHISLGARSSHRPRTTPFSFLRHTPPLPLPPSRRILLDQDGYLITHIGRGAFATISRVLYRPTGEVRVMKRIRFESGGGSDTGKNGLAEYLARNEIETLKAMEGCAWFPRLLNHFRDETEFLVTMPFYERGDLSGLLQHKGYLGRELAQFYCAQLILAIHSLHKKGILHRDIKTDNIFLSPRGHLILADLGLAENIAQHEGGEESLAQCFPAWVAARARGGDDFPLLWVGHANPLGTCGVAGTFWYTAPEVFRKEHYSFGVDYWSVGVVYHELVTGHIPFNHYKPYPENKRPILDFRIKPGQLKDVAAWEIEAISELLQPRPEDRPQTLTAIKNNRIFQGVDWAKMARREIPPPLLPPPLHEG